MINKYSLGLLLILLAGAAGWYYGSSQVVIQKEYIEGEVRTITRTVIVERTVQPDGTITERTTTEDKKQEEKTIENRVTEQPVAAQYSLGIQFNSNYTDLVDITKEYRNPDRYVVVGGRRILGPMWIELLGNTKQLGLGVRYEF